MLRKFFQLIILVLIGTAVSGQPLSKSDYLRNSGRQKIAASVLAPVGAIMVVTSLIIPPGHNRENGIYYGDNDHTLKNSLLITGIAATGVGVTLFVASRKNNERAMKATTVIRVENKEMIVLRHWVSHPYPALAIKLEF